MTILEPKQPWPQIYFRRYKYLSFPFGYWEEGYEDKSIIDLILNAKELFLKNFYQPKTLFAGPRAKNKIKDLISRNSYMMNELTIKFISGENQKEKKFLGLDLVFTIDDGLWIA
jgi:hypothetical protein